MKNDAAESPMDDGPRKCGIIMPISACGDCTKEHWADVRSIIESTCQIAGYTARLVSDTFESNLIHKEILQNIYTDDIVVCDVSCHNPNVFFELGIRMATQKPIIIVKDDMTNYPFDTSPNRYIQYRRDLRHPSVESFKEELSTALKRSENQKESDSFIGQLGPFKVPEVDTQSVDKGDFILDRLELIEARLRSIDRKTSRDDHYANDSVIEVRQLSGRKIQFVVRNADRGRLGDLAPMIKDIYGNIIDEVRLHDTSSNRSILEVRTKSEIDSTQIREIVSLLDMARGANHPTTA